MMQIAIYGKGGIGKSTVSANLSAALARCGSRVLQIGCDPKHDSTRLLHHGQPVQTVLDYILNTPEDCQRLDGVLMNGFLDVGCVEAGGPRPGMGCAGRGILTAFEFLKRFDAFSGYDEILYDVLGDVVCGGFAVPVRKQYANAIFLVSSGESMSIYAANNILHGIKNLSPGEKRIAGIIYNSRGVGDDAQRVKAFAEAVGLPISAQIPRSNLFACAEREALTVVERDPQSTESKIFYAMAEQIQAGLPLYQAAPMDEEQMEQFMRGRAIPAHRKAQVDREATPPTPTKRQEICSHASTKRALADPFSRTPLYGCAFNGAVALAIHIKDAAVLAHAPQSCVWFSQNGFTAYARRGLYERGILYPAFIPRQFEASNLTVREAVFGGVERAREKALELVRRGAKAMIVVTACVPGLSGDDLSGLKAEIEAMGCAMYIVPTDGVEAGDYNQGMSLCYQVLANEMVQRDVPQDADALNLVYEHTISAQTDRSYQMVTNIVNQLGLHINCRFICDTTVSSVQNFLKAPYSVLARDDTMGLTIKAFFEKTYGCQFLPGILPKGFSETVQWVKLLGDRYGREREAQDVISAYSARYWARIEQLRPFFCGKSVLIFLNSAGHNWVLQIAGDLNLHVVKTMLIGTARDGNANWNNRFCASWAENREALADAVAKYQPEMILINDLRALAGMETKAQVIHIPRDVTYGFWTGIEAAEKWVKYLDHTLEGRWRYDRAIFEKYHC